MELNSRLAEFLHDAAARKFEWGQFDCALWLADWYAFAAGKPDPASHLRGLYNSEHGCGALFGKAAAARMVREIARRTGLKRTDDPFFGDVGVIEIPLPKQIICGAIRSRMSWTVLMPGSGLQRIPDDLCRTVMAFSIEESDAPSCLPGSSCRRERVGGIGAGGRADHSRNIRHSATR